MCSLCIISQWKWLNVTRWHFGLGQTCYNLNWSLGYSLWCSKAPSQNSLGRSTSLPFCSEWYINQVSIYHAKNNDQDKEGFLYYFPWKWEDWTFSFSSKIDLNQLPSKYSMISGLFPRSWLQVVRKVSIDLQLCHSGLPIRDAIEGWF